MRTMSIEVIVDAAIPSSFDPNQPGPVKLVLMDSNPRMPDRMGSTLRVEVPSLYARLFYNGQKLKITVEEQL